MAVRRSTTRQVPGPTTPSSADAARPGAGADRSQASGLPLERLVERADLLGHRVTGAVETPLTGPAAVRRVAETGPRGPGNRLPHLDAVQAAFGRHDVGSVAAHYGGEAARSAGEIGTEAYASGERVVFASASPGLFAAAHEAAHVVQQRTGVDLPDGVGRRGDVYERHADAVAQRATRGESAEDLLDEGPRRPPAASQAESPVQGLTGFEVELQEPIYTVPGKAREPVVTKRSDRVTPAIKAFLGGGLRYGLNYGEHPDGLFDLTADHGSFASLHAELVAALQEEGYIDSGWKYVAMTDMEYRTPPLEERESGSITRSKKITAAVQSHVTATETEAKKDGMFDVPAPALELKTGIPKADLDAWILSTDAKSQAALSKIKSYTGYVYHQVTTGVLPSEVPALFGEAQAGVAAGPLPEMYKRVIAKMLTESVRIASETVSEEAFNLFAIANKKPLQGWLALVAQYLLANKLEATTFLPESTTAKNLVPYLSKTPLTKSVAALPPDSRPSSKVDSKPVTKDEWIDVFKTLLDKVVAVDPLTWSGDLVARVSPGKFFGGTPVEFLDAILAGAPAPVVGTGRPLGLDAGQESLKPDLSIPGEQAIALEDRFASYKSLTARTAEKTSETLDQEFDRAFKRRYASAGVNVDLERLATFVSLSGKKPLGEEALSPEQIAGEYEQRIKKAVVLQHQLYKTDPNYYLTQINHKLPAWRKSLKPTASKKEKEEGEKAFKDLERVRRLAQDLIASHRVKENRQIVAKPPVLRGGEYV